MKKDKIVLSEDEKILSQLTGQVGNDKKLLIGGINLLRNKNAPYASVVNLGHKLYQILLDNGLNESDVINPERLLGKVEGYAYNENYDMAISILEVLDAIAPFQKYSKSGNNIYAVVNGVEKQIAENILVGKKDKVVEFIYSPRSIYNDYKLQIYHTMGDEKMVKSTATSILEFNPASFNAHLNLALLSSKNLKKYKELLDNCYTLAYTVEHLISLFSAYADYFEQKGELITAYSILSCVKVYEDVSLISSELDRLSKEMNKTVISPYKVPNSDQVLKTLKMNNLHYIISSENFSALCNAYEEEYRENGDTDYLVVLKKNILAFAKNPQIIKDLEKSSKAKKEE